MPRTLISGLDGSDFISAGNDKKKVGCFQKYSKYKL